MKSECALESSLIGFGAGCQATMVAEGYTEKKPARNRDGLEGGHQMIYREYEIEGLRGGSRSVATPGFPTNGFARQGAGASVPALNQPSVMASSLPLRPGGFFLLDLGRPAANPARPLSPPAAGFEVRPKGIGRGKIERPHRPFRHRPLKVQGDDTHNSSGFSVI